MARPTAILFDADGVLQRPPPDLAARLARALGLAASKADAFILDLFKAEAEAMTGAVDFATCAQSALSDWGLTCAPEIFNELWHQIDIDWSVLSVVAELRSDGLFCALASNQQHHRARCMSIDLGYAMLFDAEFYSCDVGHAKPSEAFFAAILKSARLLAEHTLFIDDRTENIEAARRAGLQAALFTSSQLLDGGDTMRQLLAMQGI